MNKLHHFRIGDFLSCDAKSLRKDLSFAAFDKFNKFKNLRT